MSLVRTYLNSRSQGKSRSKWTGEIGVYKSRLGHNNTRQGWRTCRKSFGLQSNDYNDDRWG